MGHSIMNYPETKCLNCEAVIPARTRKKRFCDDNCGTKYRHKQKWGNDKNYWKRFYQYQKVKEQERIVERWAKMYFKLGHNEMRKLAGLKSEEPKQAETVAELFALKFTTYRGKLATSVKSKGLGAERSKSASETLKNA